MMMTMTMTMIIISTSILHEQSEFNTYLKSRLNLCSNLILVLSTSLFKEAH